VTQNSLSPLWTRPEALRERERVGVRGGLFPWGTTIVKECVLALALCACCVGCSQNDPALSQAAAARSAAVTLKNAVEIVSGLPEVRRWDKYIRRKTDDRAHGAVMEFDNEPWELNGRRYWTVSFGENSPEAFHRWHTFLVRIDSPEILVDNIIDGSYRTLEQFRRGKPQDTYLP